MDTRIIKNMLIKGIALTISFLITYALKAEHISADNSVHLSGLYGLGIVKMVLGCITIIGALGFFITTSQRRAHWPVYIRRTFFGIFVFCSIINQALFNVIGLPGNKKALALIGTCTQCLFHK